jgi:hypothetical protein
MKEWVIIAQIIVEVIRALRSIGKSGGAQSLLEVKQSAQEFRAAQSDKEAIDALARLNNSINKL